MEVFLFEDVEAEVDVNPDDVEEVMKPKRKRRTTSLTKTEKKVLVDKLKALIGDSHEAIDSIIKSMDDEAHLHVFKQRETFYGTGFSSNTVCFQLFSRG